MMNVTRVARISTANFRLPFQYENDDFIVTKELVHALA